MVRKTSGQITVFLSLMLMVLLSFLCTALRSAQTAGSRYLFSLATEAVTRSIFGVYDTRLWEQYRILALTDTELAMIVGEECGQVYEKNGTLFPVEITSIVIHDPVTLTEQEALAWRKGAVSYMEARLPIDAVSAILEQADLLEGLEDMVDWITTGKEMIRPILRLEQALAQWEKKCNEALETYQRGVGLLEELKSCCQTLTQLLKQTDTMTWEEFDTAWTSLEESYHKIQKYVVDSGRQWEVVEKEAEDHLALGQKLMEQIQGWVDTQKEEDSLWRLADLGGYLSGLSKRCQDLQQLPDRLSHQKETLQQIAQWSLPQKDTVWREGAQEHLQALQQALESVWQEEAVTEVVSWSGSTEGNEEGLQTMEALARIREWLDQGILTLVVEEPDQISQAMLQDALVRKGSENATDSNAEEESALSLLYEKALYSEYALRYTAHYGRNAGAGLQYETEQLIVGKGSDAANLAAVASRLLLVRGALNMMYLLQSDQEQQAVQWAAASISAALGGWIPSGLAAVLIMMVWAMAEAVCDVRALLAGKQVPFWKDATSWKLALEHVWTLWEDGFLMGMDQRDGMNYGTYLRLFLFAVPLEEVCFRTMEVAQENLKAERSDFSMEQAMVSGMITVTGTAAGKDLELSLPYGYP